jgi:hypothetical protein
MAASEVVTGVQVFVVGSEEKGPGTIITSDLHIPHAVTAAEVDANRPRAVCGLFVDQVLSDVPFPPASTVAMPQQPCPECIGVLRTSTGGSLG